MQKLPSDLRFLILLPKAALAAGRQPSDPRIRAAVWTFSREPVRASAAVFDVAPLPGSHCETAIAGSAWLRRTSLEEALRALRQTGAKEIGIEALEVEEARRAVAAGASFVVARGFEGPGFVSEESVITLTRSLLRAKLGVPVWARGGIGPGAAAGLARLGAQGFILDAAFWLCRDAEVDAPLKLILEKFNALDTKCLGGAAGLRFRVFAQTATRSVREATAALGAGADAASTVALLMEKSADPAQGDPAARLVSLGQDAAFAAWFAGMSIDESATQFLQWADEHLAAAARRWPLSPGEGIAKHNGTLLPLHQGPMAQVSDVPRFAKAVADAGALPWLALGNMPPDVADRVIRETAAIIGGKPFGVGIIGLDANRFRDAHIEIINKLRPPFALVAAGSIEQAQAIERQGVATYLHTPTPDLVRNALSQGVTRLILEGNEAGGHVGSLGSAVLWELGARFAFKFAGNAADPAAIALVLAGGISDVDAAIVAGTILAPFACAGGAAGIQMGTAYLMTEEAVAMGAIGREYQEQILKVRRTRLLGETVGAPTRMLASPAAARIGTCEMEWLQAGHSLRERKESYEYDNLGGLRAAAKGERIAKVDPIKGAEFVKLGREEQIEKGLFHAGQGVVLHDRVLSLQDLHATVCALPDSPKTNNTQLQSLPPGAIAIVGMAVHVAGADSVDAFWKMSLDRHVAIGEVDPLTWDPALFYDADRKKPGKTYSKIGSFLPPFVFDSKKYKIAPTVASHIDVTQRLAILLTDRALASAEYDRKPFNRENCAVILGNSRGGDLRDRTSLAVHTQNWTPTLSSLLCKHGFSSEQAAAAAAEFLSIVGIDEPITEDTMPGELANIIAGRVAAVFDLHGPNFVCDAACASSLAAVEASLRGLRSGQFDMAVTGGVDCSMSPATFVKFSKIGALSDTGSRPFDKGANGFVVGEGGAVFILKRAEDALRDGDKILALIRGVGSSSDGKGKGITAPNPQGQRLAIRRAYADAGVSVSEVDYFEAHGTSTPIGDATEYTTLTETLVEAGRTAPVMIASAKGNIGHLKSAAGAVGLARAVLAVGTGTFPPQTGFEKLPEKLAALGGPLRVLKEPMPWRGTGPRRAGVSAFGFGGTNFHVVVESLSDEPRQGERMSRNELSSTDRKAFSAEQVRAKLLDIVCARTGYAPGEIEDDFELEADLGIDTVKQAEVMAEARAQFELAKDEAFRLADYPTLGKLTAYVHSRVQNSGESGASPAVIREMPPMFSGTSPTVRTKLLEIVCARTGYAPSEIEDDFELEADLGIDTVKQAEIMAEARAHFGLTKDEAFRLADHPTLGKLAAYVQSRASTVETATESEPPRKPEPPSAPEALRKTERHQPEQLQIVSWGAADPAGLAVLLESFIGKWQSAPGDALVSNRTQWVTAKDQPYRLAIAGMPGNLGEKTSQALQALRGGASAKRLEALGIAFADEIIECGKVAFLFPGQGSQYVGMGRQLVTWSKDAANVFQLADHAMSRELGRPLTEYLFADPENAVEAETALMRTEVTQPAVLAMDIAMLETLKQYGAVPDCVAGHSLGEYAACVAAGILDLEQAFEAVSGRGREMARVEPEGGDAGRMVAVMAPPAVIEDTLRQVEGYVVIANSNSPRQSVIGGATQAVLSAVNLLTVRGIDCIPLPVSHAFHTRIVAAAAAPLEAILRRLTLKVPRLPIASNVTGGLYPAGDQDAILRLLSQQVASPVRFIENIETLYEQGCRTFIEVGPKRALSSLVSDILGQRAHVALFTNHPKSAEIESFALALAKLKIVGALDRDVAAVESDRICVTGVAIGLPGAEDPFDPSLIDALFEGRTCLSLTTIEDRERMAAKKITKLEKTSDGRASFSTIESGADVIHLAGRLAVPDLEADYGYEAGRQVGIDPTSRLAIAAGLRALADAALPLIPKYKTTVAGKQLRAGWALAPMEGDRTGVIYASIFSGLDSFAQIAAETAIGIPFPRDFLMRVLGMGHAWFAAHIGARGPNMRIDAACASAVAALATASDWIRSGRCDRVVVLTADNATGDSLFEWLGSGFLAAGAATTAKTPEEGALPFDRRRSGMILGAGAAAFVLEKESVARERGLTPRAELVCSTLANSAGHPTRLDVEHVGVNAKRIVENAAACLEIDPREIEEKGFFMSHETYTPARGGSAEAEVAALRNSFDHAERVTIANTKGYTGHAMGAGIEDAIALLSMERRALPPIANLQQPDEGMAELRFSRGGQHPAEFALRIAAGFGSQIGLLVYRRMAEHGNRVDSVKHGAWLRTTTGLVNPVTEVTSNTLRATERPVIFEGPMRRTFWAPVVMPAPQFARRHTVHLAGSPSQVKAVRAACFTANIRWSQVPQDADLIVLLVDCESDPAATLIELRGATLLIDKLNPHAHFSIWALSQNPDTDPNVGIAAGFTRALAKEWADIRKVSGLEIANRGGSLPAEQFFAFALRPQAPWLRWDAGWFQAEDRDEVVSSVVPNPDEVWVVSGGARGIAVPCLEEIVSRGVKRIAILGRTEPAGGTEVFNEEAERTLARERLNTAARKVTPVALDREVEQVRVRHEVRRSLDSLRSRGVDLMYIGVDVASSEDVLKAADKVYVHWGRADVLVHAAGIEDSRRLESKDEADLRRVTSIKYGGLCHLAQAFGPLGLRRAVVFSSIAARYGNAAQTDYAAANEAMARYARGLDLRDGAVIIDWTAWAEVGMATRGSVPAAMRAMGVELLSPKEGAAAFAALSLGSAPGEWVVAKSLGQLHQAAPVQTGEAAAVLQYDPSEAPLADHCIEGTAVFPGALGLHAFGELAESMSGGGKSLAFFDVSFQAPLKYYRGASPEACVAISREGKGYAARLASSRQAPNGRKIETRHFTARLEDAPAVGDGNRLLFDDAGPFFSGAGRDEIYRRFFHTGAFRVLNRVVVQTRRFLCAETSVRNPALPWDAFALEAMFQAAAYHTLAWHGVHALPSAIAEAMVFPEAPPAEAMLWVRVVPTGALEADAEIVDKQGRLFARMKGFRMIELRRAEPYLAAGLITSAKPGMLSGDVVALGALALSEEEHDASRHFPTAARTAEFKAGRAALKLLASETAAGWLGKSIEPSCIRITSEPGAAAFLEPRDLVTWGVSISHRSGRVVVAVSPPGWRVGVDIERMENRPDSFIEHVATQRERSALPETSYQADWVATALWTAKEAVSKAIGSGLALDVHEIEALAPPAPGLPIVLALTGEAARQAGCPAVEVGIKFHDGFIVSQAMLPAERVWVVAG